MLLDNAFYAYHCIFRTREYINNHGIGDGSAFMTKVFGTFTAGLAIVLTIALAISIGGCLVVFCLQIYSGHHGRGWLLSDNQ